MWKLGLTCSWWSKSGNPKRQGQEHGEPTICLKDLNYVNLIFLWGTEYDLPLLQPHLNYCAITDTESSTY